MLWVKTRLLLVLALAPAQSRHNACGHTYYKDSVILKLDIILLAEIILRNENFIFDRICLKST